MDSLLSIEERLDRHFHELDAQAQTILETATVNGETGDYIIPFDKFVGWATSVLVLLKQIFTEESIHFQHFQDICHSYQEYGYQFESARAIFLAAKEDYEGGYVFNIRALVTAGVLAEALEQAKE